MSDVLHGQPLLEDQDLHYFNEGTHRRLYEKLGSHLGNISGQSGTHFAVWAPNAEAVSVIGAFNGWRAGEHPLVPLGSSGIWEGFVPGVGEGELYKYRIVSNRDGQVLEKADPFAVATEVPPKTASVVRGLDYAWGDADWMAVRKERNALDAPISVYEVHLGSWRRKANHDSLSYGEMATELVEYVQECGFTHVELLPVMEHPYYASWGYQCTSYFAPSARYGTPQELMQLIDAFHQAGIGVLLDWVPSHFPEDPFALGLFDGTHLYEHEDKREGFHPDWKSLIFNYGRHEVRSFLLSSARFWMDRYHADGLRVDAVASMLYRNYSRKDGEWVPNKDGGKENLEAISFLKALNESIYEDFPDAVTVSEESTDWPKVSRPVSDGGLGFGMKWDMGWMHDTLDYMAHDPIHRKHHHRELTFRFLYAFNEHFMLSLSHDEVTHGKGSLLNKLPGDDWQKLANLRLLFGNMFAQPGKKLLFMGMEFGQHGEWNHDASLEWHLLNISTHAGVKQWVRDLHEVYKFEPALYERDFDGGGFTWLDADDAEHSILAFLRRSKDDSRHVVAVCNFTPVARLDYLVGLPHGGEWVEALNSDGCQYGGSGIINPGSLTANEHHYQGQKHSVEIALPPLGCVFLRPAEASGDTE